MKMRIKEEINYRGKSSFIPQYRCILWFNVFSDTPGYDDLEKCREMIARRFDGRGLNTSAIVETIGTTSDVKTLWAGITYVSCMICLIVTVLLIGIYSIFSCG